MSDAALSCHRRVRLFDIQTLHRNHGLCTGTYTEFAEDRRHVGLDGCFTDIQIVGDLFIEHAFRHHREDAELLRRQTGQTFSQIKRILIRLMLMTTGGSPVAASKAKTLLHALVT